MTEIGIFYFVIAIMALLATVLLAVGIGMKISISNKLRQCTAVTTGSISHVDYERISGTDLDNASAMYSYFPYYQYIVNGVEYHNKGYGTAKQNYYSQGQKIIVHYNPSDVEQCYFEENLSVMNSMNVIFRLIGAVLLIALCAVIFIMITIQ